MGHKIPHHHPRFFRFTPPSSTRHLPYTSASHTIAPERFYTHKKMLNSLRNSHHPEATPSSKLTAVLRQLSSLLTRFGVTKRRAYLILFASTFVTGVILTRDMIMPRPGRCLAAKTRDDIQNDALGTKTQNSRFLLAKNPTKALDDLLKEAVALDDEATITMIK